MFQCNEHVEMNKFLCSFACTWMTIIDSQIYIIDSLSLDISLNEVLTLWLPGCIKYRIVYRFISSLIKYRDMKSATGLQFVKANN